MATSMYERQEKLKLTMPKSVAVVGVGGVGSWLAYFLALAGVPELWLFDADEVSESNLNRLPLTKEAINKVKSVALSDMLIKHRPECSIYAMRHFSTPTAEGLRLEQKVQWIVPTTDTFASRQEVAAWAKAHKIKYLEAASEGEIGTVTAHPPEWATEAEQQPGYAHVPVWVGPCVMAASIAAGHILHNEVPDATFRLGFEFDSGQPRFESAVLEREGAKHAAAAGN